MDSFKLVYILKRGENWEGLYTYEFLFTDDLDEILNRSELLIIIKLFHRFSDD